MGSIEREQGWGRAGLLAVAMAALVFGSGCSNTPSWSEVKLMPKLSEVMPRPAVGTNAESAGLKRPVTPADLVDAQGVCAAAAAPAAADGEAVQPMSSVGLFMTECQVVQRLGTPQVTDISRTARGEREVTMTFFSAAHAGLYRFISGRLKSIERAPGAAEPENKRSKRRS